MKNLTENFANCKKIASIAAIIAFSVIVAFTACSCTGQNSDQKKKELSVCEASEPQTIDPGLNSTVDGANLVNHLFEGIARWNCIEGQDLDLVPGIVEELSKPVSLPDGTYTYTYKLKDGVKWSDGQPLTAQDIVYGWNRGCSFELASDFSYMFAPVVGYDDIWEVDEPDPDAKLDIKAVDDKTFVAHVNTIVPYWDELMAFPVFFPSREDVVDPEGMWATKPDTYIGNGSYKLKEWKHNSVIVLEKNDEYWDKDNVTMDKLNYYLSDNDNNQLANFLVGDWDLIKGVPTNEIATIKKNNPESFNCEANCGTYYITWNDSYDISPVGGEKLTASQAAEVRRAFSLMTDRNYICENVVQGGNLPASSFVPFGIKDSKDNQFYQMAGKAGNPYYGYYDTSKEGVEKNYSEALEILHKYYNFDESGNITNFPPITYSYNTNEGHKAIAEYIQSVFASVGVNLTLENQEWATFLQTRKQLGFTIARCSWLADYNDPTTFLNMYISTSPNNDACLGRKSQADVKAYSIDCSDIPGYEKIKVENGTWAETYDVVCAAIAKEMNLDVRDKLCHKAEDLLMSTSNVVPLYYYTDIFLLQPNVHNVFTTATGFRLLMHAYKD